MKREAFTHAKFALVARDLKLPLCYVRGIVTSIWLVTATNYPRGDIGRLTNEEIAIGIDYPGDENELIDVLVKRRLLDRVEDGRLYVHDWHEHCEKSIHAMLAKRGLYFANGAEPEIAHDYFDGPTRARIRAEYEKRRAASESPGVLPEKSPILPEFSRSSPKNHQKTPEIEPEEANKGDFDREPLSSNLPHISNQNSHSPGENSNPPGEIEVSPGVLPPNPQPQPQPTRKKSTKRKAQPADVEIPKALDTPEFRAEWANWERYRAEKRKPLTPSSRARQLAKLESAGVQEAIRAIGMSIENGWQGLFPENNSDGTANSNECGRVRQRDFAATYGPSGRYFAPGPTSAAADAPPPAQDEPGR